MSEFTILASGGKWSRVAVFDYLCTHGVAGAKLEDAVYELENLFSKHMIQIGARAEWSIRLGEVSGQMEDFQFDLDQIHGLLVRQIISEWADK